MIARQDFRKFLVLAAANKSDGFIIHAIREEPAGEDALCIFETVRERVGIVAVSVLLGDKGITATVQRTFLRLNILSMFMEQERSSWRRRNCQVAVQEWPTRCLVELGLHFKFPDNIDGTLSYEMLEAKFWRAFEDFYIWSTDILARLHGIELLESMPVDHMFRN